jgi:hypothetical protein
VRYFIALTVVLVAVSVDAFCGEAGAAPPPKPALQEDARPDLVPRKLSIDLLADYLNRWEIKHFEMDVEAKLAFFDVIYQEQRFSVWAGILGEDSVLFVAFRGIAAVPKDSPNLAAVLQLLMKENYTSMIGSWGWDPEKGEVALFYVSLVSAGITFKDFASAMDTLLVAAARVKAALGSLSEPQQPAAVKPGEVPRPEPAKTVETKEAPQPEAASAPQPPKGAETSSAGEKK